MGEGLPNETHFNTFKRHEGPSRIKGCLCGEGKHLGARDDFSSLFTATGTLISVEESTSVFSPPLPCLINLSFPLHSRQEQSLLQPPPLQLLNGMGPLGRRASDGGANIQLHAQQLLKRPRGPSPLVTMTPVSSSTESSLLSLRLLLKWVGKRGFPT